MSAPAGAKESGHSNAQPVAKPAVAQEDPPFDIEETATASAPVKPAAGSQKAEDILAMIRSRQNKS
jgi:hypothetical protein